MGRSTSVILSSYRENLKVFLHLTASALSCKIYIILPRTTNVLPNTLEPNYLIFLSSFDKFGVHNYAAHVEYALNRVRWMNNEFWRTIETRILSRASHARLSILLPGNPSFTNLRSISPKTSEAYGLDDIN